MNALLIGVDAQYIVELEGGVGAVMKRLTRK
jgi:hypothetical protein